MELCFFINVLMFLKTQLQRTVPQTKKKVVYVFVFILIRSKNRSHVMMMIVLFLLKTLLD